MVTENSFMDMDPGERSLYKVYEVYKVHTNHEAKLLPAMGVLENRLARPSWGIDAMLIDEELLYLEDDEADKMYQALKEKSLRKRHMEARENRLSTQMMLDDSAKIAEGDDHLIMF